MTPHLELIVTSGALSGARIPVESELVIGRDTGEGLCLDEDQRVSRKHARISAEPNRAPIIEDLGSGNGTFVNGKRIESERLLESGDVVIVGTTVFEVLVSAPAGEAETISEARPRVRRLATIEYDGEVITVTGGEQFVIGREPECEIVVRSHEASRRHARVGQIDGRWALTDLGSMNGTYLNGERLTNESRWLMPGDSFTVGGEKLTFDEAVLPM